MSKIVLIALVSLTLQGCDGAKPADSGPRLQDATADGDDSPPRDSSEIAPEVAEPNACPDGAPPRMLYLDRDHDGYGVDETGLIACPFRWRVEQGGDCDDADPDRSPGQDEACDGDDDDCDGYIDDGATVTCYDDDDEDGYGDPRDHQTRCWTCDEGTTRRSNDCDDARDDVRPSASELCDGIDNNCDGEIDEGAPTGVTLYRDSDRDGFGNARFTSTSCATPYAWVTDDTDCDDHDEEIRPGAFDGCDGDDNDCDGETDEDAITITCYDDDDDDGYGDSDEADDTCEGACDDDASELPGDCDDRDDTRSPGVTETCDSVDDDCDGEVDEGLGDGTVWYRDADGDGYGDPDTTSTGCDTSASWVLDKTDCNDVLASVFPGAEELCDRRDDDCDGEVDEGFATSTWYDDQDEDGYGDPEAPEVWCVGKSEWSDDATDCYDNDPHTHPGATEGCSDGWDNDCDGLLDCEDDDCEGDADCAELDCHDGLDGDGDGYTDCLDDECWGASGCTTTVVARVLDAGSAKKSWRRSRDGTHDTCETVTWFRSEAQACARARATGVEGTVRVYAAGEPVRACAWGIDEAKLWTCQFRERSDTWSSRSTTSGSQRDGFWVSGSCGFSDSDFLPPLSALTDQWFTWYGANGVNETAPFFDEDPSTGCNERFSDPGRSSSYASSFGVGTPYVFTLTSDTGG